MPVAELFYVPRSEDELIRFAFHNIAHHRDVSNWISANKNVNVQIQDIYPIPLQDIGGWLISHQSWHTQINSVLGTRSNNLLSADFKDYDALSGFIFLHGEEHRSWTEVTGIP